MVEMFTQRANELGRHGVLDGQGDLAALGERRKELGCCWENVTSIFPGKYRCCPISAHIHVLARGCFTLASRNAVSGERFV